MPVDARTHTLCANTTIVQTASARWQHSISTGFGRRQAGRQTRIGILNAIRDSAMHTGDTQHPQSTIVSYAHTLLTNDRQVDLAYSYRSLRVQRAYNKQTVL